ncbi:fas-binding factor 1 homolog [Athene noctua]|uniref:fas-binding factor 1 homolog n=2 Tax=Athene noctua TaxID=126797 RepID=UPI003EBF7EFA
MALCQPSAWVLAMPSWDVLSQGQHSSCPESVDDLLDDLLGYEKPHEFCEEYLEDFFDRLLSEDVEGAEGSSASGREPQALLQSLKDLDDLEVDPLGASRAGSGPGQATVKGPGKGESGPAMEKKPLSSFAASRQYRKFNFEDLDDPLSGLLSDEEQDAPKKPALTGAESIPEMQGKQSKEQEPRAAQTPLRTAAPTWRRKEITFDEDITDLMDAIGLGSSPGRDGKKAEDREEVRPARAVLDELLGRGSASRILEEPGLGERREVAQKYHQKQPEKEEGWRKEDFVFGAYQPSVASTAKGQPARRQPVRDAAASPHSRFSAEKNSEVKAEPLSKAPPLASQRPVQGRRNRGDWRGLKDKDILDLELSSPPKASPAAAGRPGPARQLPAGEEAAARPAPVEEEEDWLSAALSRKKAQAQAKAQQRSAKPSEAPAEGLNRRSPVRMLFACSRPAASPGARPQAAAVQAEAVSTDSSRPPLPWLSTAEQGSAQPSEAAQWDPSGDASAPVPAALYPGEQETQGPAPLAQAESPGLGLLHERKLGAPAAQLHEGCRAALFRAQARVAELESQVQTLELARAQDKLLLEILRQRHQEDLDLLDSTHRSQVKMLEETCRQREQRLRQEKEQLVAQLQGQRQEAERERAELLAQHLAELEHLRELQRVSVQELRREHEQQLQQLKCLKDQEVEAVTSATSHTRTLNGVVDRMEKFYGTLCDVLRKVEATQQTTSQELAMGTQKQEKYLKELQDSLCQQQREAEEDGCRFREMVAKLEARLDEQTGLLEEHQRLLAERSKVESLEEAQQALTQQLLERVELEKAKSAVLQEQLAVTRQHAGEPQKLAAERAEFDAQQQPPPSKEQATARALPVASEGEGPVRSMAKEWAKVKMRAHTLRAQEEQLAREKELLDKLCQELKAERENVHEAALRVRLQEEEMRRMTKLSSQKYEEGQRALQEARRVESQDQSSLQALQWQLEQLRQQKECLHQGRLSMAQQRSQLQQLRQEASNSPTMVRPARQDCSALLTGSSSVPGSLGGVEGLQAALKKLVATASSAELSATVAMMKFRVLQNRAYLDEEQLFLESLKKAPYNAASVRG